MSRFSAAALAVTALLGWFLAAGCGAKNPTAPDGTALDFSLIDVNPTSGTYDQAVSPRRYLGSISAWYFGHAT